MWKQRRPQSSPQLRKNGCVDLSVVEQRREIFSWLFEILQSSSRVLSPKVFMNKTACGLSTDELLCSTLSKIDSVSEQNHTHWRRKSLIPDSEVFPGSLPWSSWAGWHYCSIEATPGTDIAFLLGYHGNRHQWKHSAAPSFLWRVLLLGSTAPLPCNLPSCLWKVISKELRRVLLSQTLRRLVLLVFVFVFLFWLLHQ